MRAHVLVLRQLGQHAGPEGDDAARAPLRVHHRRRDRARPAIEQAGVGQCAAQQAPRAARDRRRRRRRQPVAAQALQEHAHAARRAERGRVAAQRRQQEAALHLAHRRALRARRGARVRPAQCRAPGKPVAIVHSKPGCAGPSAYAPDGAREDARSGGRDRVRRVPGSDAGAAPQAAKRRPAPRCPRPCSDPNPTLCRDLPGSRSYRRCTRPTASRRQTCWRTPRTGRRPPAGCAARAGPWAPARRQPVRPGTLYLLACTTALPALARGPPIRAVRTEGGRLGWRHAQQTRACGLVQPTNGMPGRFTRRTSNFPSASAFLCFHTRTQHRGAAADKWQPLARHPRHAPTRRARASADTTQPTSLQQKRRVSRRARARAPARPARLRLRRHEAVHEQHRVVRDLLGQPQAVRPGQQLGNQAHPVRQVAHAHVLRAAHARPRQGARGRTASHPVPFPFPYSSSATRTHPNPPQMLLWLVMPVCCARASRPWQSRICTPRHGRGEAGPVGAGYA